MSITQNEKTLKFIEKARKVHGDKFDYSKVEYVNSTTKVTIICPVHGEFKQRPNGHIQGKGCNSCGIENAKLKQKMTLEEFVKKAKEVHGDKYDYSKVIHKGWDNKIKIICPIHGEFEQTSGSHLQGKVGCKNCIKEKRKSREQKKNKQDFISKFTTNFGNKFDFSDTNYINNTTPVKIRCLKHNHDFYQYPANINKGNYSCKYCKEEAERIKYTKKFLEKYSYLKDRFDFSKVKYINNHTSIKLICKKHNQEFNILPSSINDKMGCRICKIGRLKGTTPKEIIEKRAENFKMPKDKYFKIAKAKHNNVYVYDENSYSKMSANIIFFCKKHGKQVQQAQSHIKGHGCPVCGMEKRVKDRKKTAENSFWKEIKAKNIDKKFDLSKFKYISIHQKSIVRCKKHGNFPISPDNLKRGKGCPKCNQSKGEEKIREFLDKNKFSYDTELTVKKLFQNSLMILGCERKRYDFVLKDKKLIIEFDGLQHFKAIDFQKKMSEEEKYNNFLENIKTDQIKDEIAQTNNYKVLRIPFWEIDNIDNILDRLLKQKDKTIFDELNLKNNRTKYDLVYEIGSSL